MIESAITAIGIANPKYSRHQNEVAELISAGLNLRPAEKRLLKSIYKATGIEKRYSVLSDYCNEPGQFTFFPNDANATFPSTSARMKIYKENALSLALVAIENCLNTFENFDKNDITHVITVSCTGMYAPGIDIEIVQTLNLNSRAKRFAINFMGCYGAFNGIKMADAICKSDSNAKVLVVCVELCTIHFQKKSDLSSFISNSIFSDGAAAIIIEANPKNKKCLSLDTFYCDLMPQTSQEMAWHVGDNGFDIVLSSYVPEVIQSGIADFIQKLFQQAQQMLVKIDIYAIHPGGLKILQACEQALNITEHDNRYSYNVLREYGNMSSATILFVLKKIWDDLQNQDHQERIFACAFGPGLTLESMLLRTNLLT